jgi:hypothetical protein
VLAKQRGEDLNDELLTTADPPATVVARYGDPFETEFAHKRGRSAAIVRLSIPPSGLSLRP